MLWVFGLAALSMSLIDPTSLEYLPYTASRFDKETIENFDQIFLWTASIGWIGALVAALFSDKRAFGRPMFIGALAAGIVMAATLFAASSFLIPNEPASSYLPLSMYFALHSGTEIMLLATVVFYGRTSTERLLIFLIVQMMFALGDAISNSLIFSALDLHANPHLQIMILAAFAVVFAIPATFLPKNSRFSPIDSEPPRRVWFPPSNRTQLGKTLSLVFLFGCSLCLSTLFLPTSTSEGSDLVVYCLLAIVAAVPITLYLVGKVGLHQISAQSLLVASTALGILLYTTKMVAALGGFRTVEIVCIAISPVLFIWMGAALLSKLSDLFHQHRPGDREARIAPTMLAFIVVLVLGNLGNLLTPIPFMFEENFSAVASLLCITIWGVLLTAAVWFGGKTVPASVATDQRAKE
jgi:hypothetical protein